MSEATSQQKTVTAHKWKRYPKYKDSGVEWLGEVPEEWKTIQIHHLCSVKRGASPRPIDDPKYFNDNGEYAWVRISDVTSSKKYLKVTEQKLSSYGKQFSVPLEPGDLFLSMAGTVGKPIISSIKCCIHDGFVYFKNIKHNRDFLFYLFSYEGIYAGLGKWGTQLNLNTEIIGAIKIPTPIVPEQIAIAVFLDHETTRIDALIAMKERQINLLQENRTALICRAVTKGLDPNVKTKDSEVEWIGEVPKHWEVRQLHRVLLRVVKKNRDTNDRKMLSLSAKKGLVYKEYDHEAQMRPKEETLEYVIVKPNQLVVNPMWIIESGIGVSLLDGIVSPAYRIYNISEDLVPLYLHYLVKTPLYISQYFRYIRGLTTYDRSVREEDFFSIEIVLPPKKEQIEIIDHIEKYTSKTVLLTRKIEESIEKLKEYRSALISAAVTGKIDVRGEVTKAIGET